MAELQTVRSTEGGFDTSNLQEADHRELNSERIENRSPERAFGGQDVGTLWGDSVAGKGAILKPSISFTSSFPSLQSPKHQEDYSLDREEFIRSTACPGSPLVNVGNYTSGDGIGMGHHNPALIKSLPPSSIGGVPGRQNPYIKDPIPSTALFNPWRAALHTTANHEDLAYAKDSSCSEAEGRDPTQLQNGFPSEAGNISQAIHNIITLSPDHAENVAGRNLQFIPQKSPAQDYFFGRMKIPRYKFVSEDPQKREETKRKSNSCPVHDKKRRKRGRKGGGKQTSEANDEPCIPENQSKELGQQIAGQVKEFENVRTAINHDGLTRYTLVPFDASYKLVKPAWASLQGVSGMHGATSQTQTFYPFNSWQPEKCFNGGYPSIQKTSLSTSQYQGTSALHVVEGAQKQPDSKKTSNAHSLSSQDRASGESEGQIQTHYGLAPFEGASTETYVTERPGPYVTTPYNQAPLQTLAPQCALPNQGMNLSMAGSQANNLQGCSYNGIPQTPIPVYNRAVDASVFGPFAFPSQVYHHPLAADPFYWYHEPALAASLFPTFIRPKPMLGPQAFRNMQYAEQQQQGNAFFWPPYPNVSSMFRAANLIPNITGHKNEYKDPTPHTVLTNHRTSGVAARLQEIPVSPKTPTYPYVTQEQSSVPSSANHDFYRSAGPDVAQEYNSAVRYSAAITQRSPTINGDKQSAPQDGLYRANGEERDFEVDVEGDGEPSVYREINSLGQEEKKIVSMPKGDHICQICGKKYARAFTLKTHTRIHTGEKPFQCDICFRPFVQASGLESHKRIHTGVKPYKCQICKRGFSHSSAVKNHLRTHTGEKPFPCRICGKRFADQSTLKKHEFTHTGEKPYKCNQCGLRFTQVGNMNKHLKNIHGDPRRGRMERVRVNEALIELTRDEKTLATVVENEVGANEISL